MICLSDSKLLLQCSLTETAKKVTPKVYEMKQAAQSHQRPQLLRNEVMSAAAAAAHGMPSEYERKGRKREESSLD